MAKYLKKLLGRLPPTAQNSIRRRKVLWDLARGRFSAGEPEFDRLAEWVRSGDVVIDVGANVGQYAVRLSELVGSTGRVIALEPVPDTISILSSVVAKLPLQNVTIVGAAANDVSGLVPLSVPSFRSGLRNFYQANIVGGELSLMSCVAFRLDDLLAGMPEVTFLKIDAEGADSQVVRGARRTIEASRPVLVVEALEAAEARWLIGLGYAESSLPGSPNKVYVHSSEGRRSP